MNVKAIAFYLPQFHPVPENDEWWGKGFTEWRNVTKAKPLFPGHYQPHLPADLGFYDLRLPEVRQTQAELARQHGIHGFCYYHYWFNGRRILERPFDEVLKSGKPDFPFCLCWANENWTRVWDGGEKDILLEQHYSSEDDLAHIRSLIPAFKDPRYIRINGKPLFLVYRTELLPDPKRTAEIWRNEAIMSGVGDLYLVRVESFTRGINPASIGFDAAVEFAPDGHDMGKLKYHDGFPGFLSRKGIIPRAFAENRIVSYPVLARGMMSRPPAPFKRFRCVTPMWDNSARRKVDARIVIDSTPELYEIWLRAIAAKTSTQFDHDERLVFINAWNEWAEGNHLEPDLKWGRGYLEATKRALEAAQNDSKKSATVITPPEPSDFTSLKNLYWRLRAFVSDQRELVRHLFRS
ncbi:MAG: glycoside hydrolase family 99-like domain-containing protein [Thiobacillus sp.]